MVSGHRGSSLECELLIHRAASEMQLSTEDETEKKKERKAAQAGINAELSTLIKTSTLIWCL